MFIKKLRKISFFDQAIAVHTSKPITLLFRHYQKMMGENHARECSGFFPSRKDHEMRAVLWAAVVKSKTTIYCLLANWSGKIQSQFFSLFLTTDCVLLFLPRPSLNEEFTLNVVIVPDSFSCYYVGEERRWLAYTHFLRTVRSFPDVKSTFSLKYVSYQCHQTFLLIWYNID